MKKKSGLALLEFGKESHTAIGNLGHIVKAEEHNYL